MNKLKSLKKKIRRLEARQQKGAKKLAKLKQKLGAAAAKTKSKTAALAGKPGKTSNVSAGAHKKQSASAAKAPSAPKKMKKKLNLTPERREQLAAAMRARWAAKRAAAAPNTQGTSFDGGGSPGDAPQPQ